jgi:hypothetical protein
MKYKGSEECIDIYWWNMGSRKLDYSGPISGYLDKRNIRVRRLSRPNTLPPCWKFNIPVSSSTVEFITYDSDFYAAATTAIQLFLTLMGDKALIKGRCNRGVNWR